MARSQNAVITDHRHKLAEFEAFLKAKHAEYDETYQRNPGATNFNGTLAYAGRGAIEVVLKEFRKIFDITEDR